MKPALSIVMPVLDEAAGIQATLAALAPLRARRAEVIVVDGGSTDGDGGGTWAVDTGDCPDDSVDEPIEGTVKIGTTLPLSGGSAAAAK